MSDRDEFLSQVKANIARSGVPFTHVQADVCPQFGYSIGLHQAGRPECVLAGAIVYELAARERIVDAAAKAIVRATSRSRRRASGGPGSPWNAWG